MLTPKQWIGIGALSLVAIFAYDLSSKISKPDFLMKNEDENKLSTWKIYHPSNDQFEVRFPALPQHVAETHPNANLDQTKYDVYLAQETDGTVYMISMTQYPDAKDVSKANDLLEGILKGAVVSNPKNQLIYSESITYFNLPALEFVIQNSDFSTKSKAILAAKTLFVVTVMGRDSGKLENDYKEFAGSFRIKNNPMPLSLQVDSQAEPSYREQAQLEHAQQ